MKQNLLGMPARRSIHLIIVGTFYLTIAISVHYLLINQHLLGKTLGSIPKLELDNELVLSERRSTSTTYVYGVTWSSDGSKIAAYSSLGEAYSDSGNLLTIWNRDGHIIRELAGTREWRFNALSPLVFVAGDKELVTPPPQDRPDLAFAVFDVESGKVVEQIEGLRPQRLRGDPPGYAVNRATRLATPPDQTVLAAAFGNALPQPIALYSTKTWQRLNLVRASPDTARERPSALAFAPNGMLLGIGRGNSQIQIYERGAEYLSQSIDAFPDIGGLNAVAFSPDSKMIAASSGAFPYTRSGSEKERKLISNRDRVRVFRTASGALVNKFPNLISPIHALTWGASGLIAFISSDGTVRIWDPSNSPASAEFVRLGATGVPLVFSPDGTHLAVPDGARVRIFRVKR